MSDPAQGPAEDSRVRRPSTRWPIVLGGVLLLIALGPTSVVADCSGDADGDGACDLEDNCPLIPNPAQQDLDADGQTFVWSPVVGAASYTLYRGTFDGRWRDDAMVLVAGLSSPRGTDIANPMPGAGYWYDSAAESVSCGGPPGSGSNGAPRSVPVP